MHEQPTLADYDIVLWKIKPSDIDDRLQIGRHHEFIYMCGGETWEKPDYPDCLDYEYRESFANGERA